MYNAFWKVSLGLTYIHSVPHVLSHTIVYPTIYYRSIHYKYDVVQYNIM